VNAANVLAFLTRVARSAELRTELRTKAKPEVLEAAARLGLPLTEPEFDAAVWGLEKRLAAVRGERFDQTFRLWHLMWGQYYLDYLVLDLLPALRETGLAPVPADT